MHALCFKFSLLVLSTSQSQLDTGCAESSTSMAFMVEVPIQRFWSVWGCQCEDSAKDLKIVG